MDQFSRFIVSRALSSPTVRCLETLTPLATQRGLDVEEVDDMAEGKGRRATDLVLSMTGEAGHVVVCTHGDVIAEVLNALEAGGADLGANYRCQKGSTWLLARLPSGDLQGRYLPPPV